MKILKRTSLGIILLIGILLSLQVVFGDVSLSVTSFSCTPSESVINNVFSCTAQVRNGGITQGLVDVATLEPDTSWLEEETYQQASGSTITPGQSVEITFSGLRAVKSGSNGFSKIMLDTVEDRYVADNNIKVNIINVAVTLSNSASSASMNSTFTSTAEVTAGGNINALLTFTVDGGGCGIGSQPSQKTITGMQDGNKQSRTWTVTMGSGGNCRYSISAAATGTGGLAIKTDTSSSSVTCTNCPTTTDSTTSAGSGGAGGGITALTLGELAGSTTKELASNEKIKFNISNIEHSLLLTNLTETHATITIESEKQTFTLIVGDEIKVDLNKDNIAEISVKLKTINVLTKKATFILTRLTEVVAPTTSAEKEKEEKKEEAEEVEEPAKKTWLWVVLILVGVIIIVIVIFSIIRKKRF